MILPNEVDYFQRLLPPPHIARCVGPVRSPSELRRNAKEYVDLLNRYALLRKETQVLDVGCGWGLMALGLNSLTDLSVRYSGFDTVWYVVEWGKKAIQSIYPNCQFDYHDLRNAFYNPRGRLLPSEFVFPFETNCFDVIVAKSLFTHLTPDDLAQFLSQMFRVLKPKGSLVASFFLDPSRGTRQIEHSGGLQFKHRFEHWSCEDANVAEIAIAYSENFVREVLESVGFAADMHIEYGRWRTSSAWHGLQDLIVVQKR